MIVFTPAWLFGLLLLGAALVAAAARFQPRYTQATAVAVTAVTLLLWLGMRTQLPIVPDTAGLYAWGADKSTWALGGDWLVLLLAALLRQREAAANSSPFSFPQHGLMLLLGGVTAVTLWAGTPALAVTAWLALALTWAVVGLLNQPAEDREDLRAPLAGLLVSVLLLWYAAALGGGAHWATWSPAARTAALVAIFVQMGSVPGLGLRFVTSMKDRETAVLLLLAPCLAGAALLLRLVASGPMPALQMVTLIGMLAVLAGILRAWAHLDDSRSLGAGMALATGGLLVLAGVWAGPDAAAAESRVLALAVGLLFLTEPMGRGRAVWQERRAWLTYGPPVLGWLLMLAALAGLPLTAGFNGRAALYQTWLQANGWVLVLVLALLHVPLVTAVFLSGLGQRPETATATPNWASSGSVLLLAVGLLALPALPLSDVNWATWLALLLPVAAGLLLARWMPKMPDWETAVRLPENWSARRLRQVGRLTVNAARDAAELLEGEQSLLWLLLLAALIVLASSG